MKISRRRLADYVKTLHQKACRTCSTIIFLHSTNQIIDLWRCRWRCRRQILSSLKSWQRSPTPIFRVLHAQRQKKYYYYCYYYYYYYCYYYLYLGCRQLLISFVCCVLSFLSRELLRDIQYVGGMQFSIYSWSPPRTLIPAIIAV